MRPRDTAPEAWRLYLKLQRGLSPSQKLQQALEWSETMRQFAEAGLRQRHPKADDREIFLRFARMKLGEELFRKVDGDALPGDEPSHRYP